MTRLFRTGTLQGKGSPTFFHKTMGSASRFLLLLFCLQATPALAEEPGLDCFIEPYLVADVGSAATGVIETIQVDRGDLVTKGQALAFLESSLQDIALKVAKAKAQADALLKTNEARLEFGTRRLARTQELFEGEISSLSELDEAETAKLLAELALIEARNNDKITKLEYEQAEAELKLRTIRSSIPGVVVERFLSPGEVIQGTPLLKVAQIDPLRVEVYVPISLWDTIVVGTQALVMPVAPIGGTYSSKVTVVDKVLDPASGTFGVRLELPNPHFQIPAGLKCTVRFNHSS